MRFQLLAAAALCLAMTSPLGAQPAAKQKRSAGGVRAESNSVSVHYESLSLANGFELIMVPDHRLPLVAVNLWVHAGPRNEAKGQTGFAHLFEHLMFAGTRHISRGEYDKIIDSVGGTDANGSTDFDRTNYYFTLPSNQLAVGLWLKADMIGYMIDEVDSVALANQQDVVRNERRQRIENEPYGIVEEALYQALFPEDHPYRALVMGSHADIQSIKLDDVKAFSKTYYRPNNATLVLAGDFDVSEAKRLVQKYFGSLKAGDPVPPVTVVQPAITSERRITVTDRVELPRLTLAWHTPAIYQPGDADLDVAASVLGAGKSSRLYKKLVYERQIAQAVNVAQDSLSLGSVFTIEVVARPDQSLDEIERVVDEELTALATRAPSAEEVQRAQAAFETQHFARMEKVLGLTELIQQYNQLAGDPGYLGKDLARHRAVTSESVRAVAAAQLRKDARVVVQAMPGPQVLPSEVPTPATSTIAARGERESVNADEPWRMRRPAAGEGRALALPAGKRFSLANGLTVVHVAKPGIPLVSAVLVVRGGQDANPIDRPGLAGFTAAMLQEGTSTRSSQALSDEIADLGAELTIASGREDARVELTSLKAKFPAALALMADVTLNPSFDGIEIERRKKARLAALAQQREQPSAVAAVVANSAIYGNRHPLGVSPLGDEASIAATDRAALAHFWQTHYRPDQSALVVAGDVTLGEARRLATALFGGWKRPDVPTASSARATPISTSAKVVMVDKPGAPQTALAVVAAGPRAGDPEAPAITVMNAAMGGLFTSRINTLLREVKGYTYGIYSTYTMGRESGIFGVRGGVRTDVTGAAVSDVWNEIEAMRAKPLGKDELTRVRNALLLSLPGQFETGRVIASSYADAWSLDLPEDYIVRQPARLATVTAARAFAAAQTYIDPASLIVIAVGDHAKLAPQFEALGREPVEMRDSDGKLSE